MRKTKSILSKSKKVTHAVREDFYKIQFSPKIGKVASNQVISLGNLKQSFQNKFIKADDVAEILYTSVQTQENCVLYGRGGHGKSEMVKYFFEAMGIVPYVKSLGQGTGIEDLLGGLNVPLFKDKGIIEYSVENSFMAHEYVVFEEAFDASMKVLEQLKDILTSGWYRNGNQQFKVQTKCIIVCTNRSRNELSDDDSIKALMERFPLELKVEWDSYTALDYSKMFKVVLGQELDEFAVLIEEANKVSFISPRTAIKASKIYKSQGIEGLRFVAGFTAGIVDALKEKSSELQQLAQQKVKYSRLRTFVLKLLNTLRSYSAGSPVKLIQASNHLEAVEKSLDDLRIPDNLVKEFRTLKAEVTVLKNQFLQDAITNTNANSDFPKISEMEAIWKN